MSPPAAPAEDDAAARRRDAWRLTLQTLGAIALLGAFFYVLGATCKPEIERIGRVFVERLGFAGVAVGVFLADAFTFPVPPQVYMLAALAGGASPAITVTVTCASSLVAGNVGYRLAARLSGVSFFRARIDAARPRLDPLFRRYGVWAVAIGSLTPMPYSILCYLAGIYRLPPRLFALLLLFRVPRILFFYVLIRTMLPVTQ